MTGAATAVGRFGLAIAVIACLAGGAVVVVSGARSYPPPAGPLPVRPFAIKPDAPSNPDTPIKARQARQGKVTVTGTLPGSGGAPCRLPLASSRLIIGSLCIDAPIVSTYQQPDGALSVPRDVHVIGMWNGGARLTGPSGKPLRRGTTLLAGHVNYAGQGEGPLYSLYQVQPDAVVYASDASGHVTRWRIISLSAVLKSELPSWVFGGPTGPRKLVIVTCGGPLDYIKGYGYSYRDNVIATAVPD